MLSALLGTPPTSDPLTGNGDFGVASLDAQSPDQRAYSPLPAPGGELLHDPDFSLPTIAGTLPWRLFYYSGLPDNTGPFAHGRRASWPARLCADTSGTLALGYLITVTLEREDGNAIQYLGNSAPNMPPPTTFTAYTPRLFDALIYTPASLTWDETRFDTGALFHYAVGSPVSLVNQSFPVSLSYYQTVLGQRVTFNYGSDGNLDTIQDPAGRQIEYGYSGGYVSNVTDWGGRTHQFGYDGNDNLQSITDPTGAITTFASDTMHRLLQITDPNGYNTYYQYDNQNRVVSRQIDVNPPGNYSYDGTTTTYTDPLGQVWQTTQDQYGNVTQTTDPLGATRNATYWPSGLPYTIEDAIGRITVLQYDDNGRLQSRQDPTGATEQWQWDPDYGTLQTYTDQINRITQYNYGSDPQPRLLLSVTTPLSNTTNYTYTYWGALLGVQTPLGYLTTYNWDNTHGVLLGQMNALGAICQRRRYNPQIAA
jgi:YD repeat-containing protein